MKQLCLFFSFLLCLNFPLQAAEVVETFQTRTQMESEEAIWNQALGKVHPSLQVVNYKPAATAKSFSVGDGSHGVFDVSTYANFSVNGDVSGNIIRFDSARFPILKVTSFHLASGWVLEPVGNSPLIIYSLSIVHIEGEIRCQGENATDAVGATAGSGGRGRCGGTDGGNGGSVMGDGGSASSAAVSVTGGTGGQYTGGAAVGGGGGGSWNSTATPGDGSNVGSGGQHGTAVADPEFLTIGGGAGGGGGSGTGTEAGAGGGGGGGVVIIHAVGDVSLGTSPASTTGFIFANGGNGGVSNGAGGPGGGGGGGSVKVFSGGTVHIYNNDGSGASQANQGAAGVNPVPALVGGIGGSGRSWFASVGYNGVGFYSPVEQAPVVANNNTVEFTGTPQSVIMRSIDLQSTLATIDAVTLTPASTDFQVFMNGSSDDFVSDQTGWSTDVATVSHKRFLKVKIVITTSNVATPTMLDGLSFRSTPGLLRDFEMKGSGCAMVGPVSPISKTGSKNSTGTAALFFLLGPLVFALIFRNHRIN